VQWSVTGFWPGRHVGIGVFVGVGVAVGLGVANRSLLPTYAGGGKVVTCLPCNALDM
jgi:hypothetical protein